MVNELSYNTISLVVDSWEQMKRDDKMEKAGSLLFQQYVLPSALLIQN